MGDKTEARRRMLSAGGPVVPGSEGSIETAEQTLSMAPGYAFGYVALWIAHHALGNEEETIRAVANMMRNIGNKPELADFLEAAFERDGLESAARPRAPSCELLAVSSASSYPRRATEPAPR